MQRGGIPHPAVADVVEHDEVAVVILVGVVLLGDIVLAVHVAVFRRPPRRIEFRDGAEVLHAHRVDASWIVVLDEFAAAPLLVDGAGDRRVDGDGVALHLGDHAIELDVEGTPAAPGVSRFMPMASIQAWLPIRRTSTASPGRKPAPDATRKRREPTGT